MKKLSSWLKALLVSCTSWLYTFLQFYGCLRLICHSAPCYLVIFALLFIDLFSLVPLVPRFSDLSIPVPCHS